MDTLPPTDTRAKGRASEDEAVAFLEGKGFTIIERNFQKKQGEIDIIARDATNTLVFVEVKSAQTTQYGHPLYFVNYAKQKKIIRMAKIYIARKRIQSAVRFDVVSIYQGKIEYLKNAFLAM